MIVKNNIENVRKETELPEVFWKPMFTKMAADNSYIDIVVRDSRVEEEKIQEENSLLEWLSQKVRLPERFWKERYESISPEAREKKWGDIEFWEKGLIKLIKDEKGEWVYLYPDESNIMLLPDL